MLVTPNSGNTQKTTNFTFDSVEIPVVKDVFSSYASRHEDLLERNLNLGFVFQKLLSTTENSHEPVSITLNPEESRFLIDEMAQEFANYVENDLIAFRDTISQKPHRELEIDEISDVPEIDSKLDAAMNMSIVFHELANISSSVKELV